MTFGAEMAAVGLTSFVWVAILSFVGGMANNYRKIAAGKPYTRSQIISDILGSFAAGLFTFFAAGLSPVPIPALGKAAAILIAGFGGAAVLEKALRKKDDST